MAANADSEDLAAVDAALRRLAGLPVRSKPGASSSSSPNAGVRHAGQILWPGDQLEIEEAFDRLRAEVMDLLPLLDEHEVETAVLWCYLGAEEVRRAEGQDPPWTFQGPSEAPRQSGFVRTRRRSLVDAVGWSGGSDRQFRDQIESSAFRRLAAALLNSRRPSPDAAMLNISALGSAGMAVADRVRTPTFVPEQDELTTSSLNKLGRHVVHRVLANLFEGATEVRYRALTPGMSGASVFAVYPHKGSAQLPCVVKVGLVDDVANELAKWDTYVEPYVGHKHIPGKRGVTFVAGVGAVAYEFIASKTFNQTVLELAARGRISEIEQMISSLFEIVRVAWHRDKHRMRRHLMVEDYVLTEGDLTSFERICSNDPALRHEDVGVVREVWQADQNRFPTEHGVSICHGDLFGENVLVDEDGELGLIDFSHSGPQHYLRDFVTMEGDLILRLLRLGDESPEQERAHIDRLSEIAVADGDQGFIVKGNPAKEPIAIRSSVAALRAIRRAAWGRMENQASEMLAYRIGLIRRLVRTSARLENRLSESQRRVGCQLALAHASLVAATFLDRSGPALAPARVAVHPAVELDLADKVADARRRDRPRFLMVGGLYLDVVLEPVNDKRLRAEEWSNLDQIQMRLGGSCLQVGAQLFEHFDVQSVLFSTIGGSDDPLTAAAASLLERQGWIAMRYTPEVSGVATAVSVHLLQGSGDFSTAFTHKGALEYLSWKVVHQNLLLEHDRGAVVYLAGYFRTSLHVELHTNLQQLGREQLIVVDHGHLVPEVESYGPVRQLRNAFARGEVDVYICTVPELQALVHHPDPRKSRAKGKATVEGIAGLARRLALPPVTVVRDRRNIGVDQAFVLFGSRPGTPEVVALSMADSRVRSMIDADNAFNAGFLHSLVRGHPDQDLHAAVVDAVREGLRIWSST